MGEATYYLKAKFDNLDTAKVAYNTLTDLLESIDGAKEYWHDNRNCPTEIKFWTGFIENYKLAHFFLTEYAGHPGIGEYTNSLSGLLSYSSIEEGTLSLDEENLEIRYDAMVWHFANWDPLVKAVLDMGALAADYISDEYVDYYDCIQLD